MYLLQSKPEIDQNYSQEMPKLSHSERQVEKYSECIYEVIYNKKQVNQVANNTEEIEIVKAGTVENSCR